MDWKAQFVSIEEAVHASVEEDFKRPLQPALENMRAYTDDSRQRIHRQIKELHHALAVGVHNVDTSAALASAATTFDSSVNPQATVVFGNDPDMAAPHGVNLAATTPGTCSTQYPSHAVTVFEEPVDERTRRLRHRIELVEDRMRRDPVWAEKVARRRAAFAATSTSSASASVLTAGVVCDGQLTARPPTTCSTDCPGRTSASAVSPITPATESTPSTGTTGTTACTARDTCVYPVAQLVAMPIPIPVAVADCAPTMAASCTDITPSPRVPTPVATKATASTALDSDLIMAPRATSFAVCLDPIPVAPATMLTQATLGTLDIMDSSGSAVLVTMSAQLDKPDGNDTAVTHKDEQVLACLSVQQPLPLFAAGDVADDCSLVTSASAVSLTLSALSVHDGRINNEDKVLLLLKLLVPCSRSKELYVSPLLPQCIQAMITLVTSLNQLHAKYSGICSDLGCASATTHSLLPWDPGEKTRASKDSVLSKDIAWNACIKQLNADCLDSYDHHQLPSVGRSLVSSDTQQELVENYSVTAVVMRLLILAVICDETVLWPVIQSATHSTILLQPWDPGAPSSDMDSKLSTIKRGLTDVRRCWIPCHTLRGNIQYTERMHGSLSHSLLQTEFGLNTTGYIICFYCALVQWEIPWTISLVARKSSFQYCILGCESVNGCQNFQWSIAWSLGSQISQSSLQTRLYCVILWVQQQSRAIYQAKWFRFLSVGLSVAGSANVLSGIVTVMFWPHFKLGMLLPLHYRDLGFWRYPSVDQTMLKAGHAIQCGLELIHLKIAWPLYLVCSTSGSKFGKLLHPTKVRSEGYLGKRNADLQPFTARTVQISLLSLAYVALWSFYNLEFCQGRLSWDPGTRPLLCFFKLLTQAEAKRRRNAAAPIYCRGHCLGHTYYFDKCCTIQVYYLDIFRDQVHIGHDNYLGVFLEQVCIIYFNLVKVCFDYGARCHLNEGMTHQVQWDPGGSTCNRLEVKPKIKEGGMLATCPTATTRSGLGCQYWAWADGKAWRQQLQIHGKGDTNNLAWNGTASASSASVFRLPPLFLFV